jgi:hypothetical protein
VAKGKARDEELGGLKYIIEKFLDVVKDVDKGIADQRSRTDDIMDQWDAYQCEFGPKQFYNGNSQIYLPIITDAVNARKVRFTNQIFPQSGRCVEVTSENEDLPQAEMAMLDHYIRRTKLRTAVIRPLMVQGDVEGQWSLYVGWKTTKRRLTRKVQSYPKVDGMEQPDLEPVDDVEEETIEEGCPDIEIIADADLMVLPVTATSIDNAIEQGGSVTILRRWTKAKIRKLIKDEEIIKSAGEALLKNMQGNDSTEKRDTAKRLASNAGIKRDKGFALIYEVWTNLEVAGEWRLCRGYYGGEDQVLGVKQCPYWCDRTPLISGPVEKLPGVFKGRAPVYRVLDMQVFANDTINEGADTAHFSAMPIVMTDPEKNPRVGSMVLGLAAVWETSPKDTSFAQFPELWRSALERAMAVEQRIQQSLGVNPSMVPQSTGKVGAKRNQAEVAMEQQVDILTTSDTVTDLEELILTPLLQRIAEYDHQFRDDVLTVRMFGEMGKRAVMQDIEPIAMNRKLEFRWFGVEAARAAAQVQQQIGFLNVLKDPAVAQALGAAGYRIDVAPAIVRIAENILGPITGPLTIVSIKDDLSLDPQLENEALEHGMDMNVHPADNDQQHMQVHMQALQMGDPHGTIRAHLQKHQVQMMMKTQAQAQMQQGGAPGGGGPKPGASPGQPHAAKGPPGQIHADRMPAAGNVAQLPRKM